MDKSSVTIIGCGWIGLPLGIKLASIGWKVLGSTTKKQKLQILRNSLIKPFLLNLKTESQIENELFNTSNLVINVPPGRGDTDVIGNYPEAIKRILDVAYHINSIDKIIFISSTSVYGSDSDIFTENSLCEPESNSGKAILLAENMVQQTGKPYLILRFGGLAGPGRHPGRFFAGRKGLTIGDQTVNFLHLDDAVHVIYYMLTHEVNNEIFNVAAPLHPTKKEFYIHMALSMDLEPPSFVKGEEKLKKREISVDKLLRNTDFSFIHPNPMEFTF